MATLIKAKIFTDIRRRKYVRREASYMQSWDGITAQQKIVFFSADEGLTLRNTFYVT